MKRKTLWRFSALFLALPMVAGPTFVCDDGLKSEDFVRIASGGVDERLNSYTWGMEQYDADNDGTPEIYIGTLGNALCLQLNGAGGDPNNPPPDRWQCPNESWGSPNYVWDCLAPAHVYRGTYDEPNDAWMWDRVWSPDLFTQVYGFRGARVFDGALYMLGNGILNSAVWETTDGENFTRVSPIGMVTPGDQGMGGFALFAGGLRGATIFNGKLYVANDSICEIYCSADPAADSSAWDQACSTGFVASGGATHEAVYSTGNPTSATIFTLTDDNQTDWPEGTLGEFRVRIIAGTGSGQDMNILARVPLTNTITIEGIWSPVPDPNSEYEIYVPDKPDNGPPWQLAVFDGHLYAATINQTTGAEVWKSSDPAPGNWTRVLEGGYGNLVTHGYMSVRPYGGYLYLGSGIYGPNRNGGDSEGCEILRMDPNDNIELLVGKVRDPNGPNEIVPLSGMDRGFDYAANVYSWYMAEYEGWFYVGTYDSYSNTYDLLVDYFGFPPPWPPSVEEDLDEWLGTDHERRRGFDLYRTNDGVKWKPVDLTGFGDGDNYGIRNMLNTQWGLMLGLSNPVDGFEVWVGKRDELDPNDPNGGGGAGALFPL